MKYAVIVAAVLGALGARGAYAQGDNNMGGNNSPPDEEKLPQKQQAPLPDQAPDRTTMKSDTDQTADQANADQDKSADKAKSSDTAKAEPEQLTDQNGKTIASTDVLFAFDSSQLAADASSQLNAIADWAKCNPKSAVIIEGHADPRGTVAYNQKLSAERAAQVRAKLVELGVPQGRIVMSVYGKQGPKRATFAEDRRATVRPVLTPVDATEITAQR